MKSVKTRLRRGLPDRVAKAVHDRDRHTCRYCGFQSQKYQQVVVLEPDTRDPSRMTTACIFCHQCFHLDWVPEMRSGVLVWLPEIEQRDLHHLAREIYVLRLSHGEPADRARRALDHLLKRRAAASEQLGVKEDERKGDPSVLVARLQAVEGHSYGKLVEGLDGLRLLPLDRRIVTVGDLHFNQFPQILAYWRSRWGPIGHLETHPRIDQYLHDVAGEEENDRLLESERPPSQGVAARPRNARPATPTTNDGGGDEAVPVYVEPAHRWTKVEKETSLDDLLAQLAPIDGQLSLEPEHTRVDATSLSWYRDTVLLRVTSTAWPIKHLAAYYLAEVTKNKNLYRLSGTASPIHEVNARVPIRLNEDNVLDYVRFFCYFVRGDEGPFYIAEDPDRLNLPPSIDPHVHDLLAEVLRPATYKGRGDGGVFLCDATVFYGNSLFRSTFGVRPTGMIEMLTDEPIPEGLPIRTYSPIAFPPRSR